MNYMEKLAESGMLGVLLVISLTAVYFLYREIQRVQDERIKDLKEARDSISEPLDAVKRTVELVLDRISSNKNI